MFWSKRSAPALPQANPTTTEAVVEKRAGARYLVQRDDQGNTVFVARLSSVVAVNAAGPMRSIVFLKSGTQATVVGEAGQISDAVFGVTSKRAKGDYT